jgi:hypothetical protein
MAWFLLSPGIIALVTSRHAGFSTGLIAILYPFRIFTGSIQQVSWHTTSRVKSWLFSPFIPAEGTQGILFLKGRLVRGLGA